MLNKFYWWMLYRTYYRDYTFRIWFRRRFSRSGKFALACLLLAGLLGLDTNESMAYQAFTFLIAVLGISSIWTRLGSRRSHFLVERQLPPFGTAGQVVTYRATVTNQSARPQRDLTYLEVLADPRPTRAEYLAGATRQPIRLTDRVDDALGYTRWWRLVRARQPAEIDECTLPDVAPRAATEVAVTFTPQRRGRVHFLGVTLGRPDVFGLLRRFVRLPLPQSLLILPKRYPLSHLALPGTSRYQQGGVALAASVGQSEEFVALRDYRAGDPLRHVHWRSVAKADRLVVREHEDEFFVRHALVLDTFADVECEEAFEEAVSVASSFACMVQSQESLLDLLFVGDRAYCFTAGRGVGHVERMLEVLAGVRLCEDGSIDSLRSLVAGHVPLVSGCVCIFLAWDEPRRELVKLLRALAVPVRVIVVTDQRQPALTDFGPMIDAPHLFHHLVVGRVREGLAAL